MNNNDNQIPKVGGPKGDQGVRPKDNRPKIKPNPQKIRQHLVAFMGTDADLEHLVAPNGIESDRFEKATPSSVIAAIRNMSWQDQQSVIGYFSRNEVIRETRVQRQLGGGVAIGGTGKGLVKGEKPKTEKTKPVKRAPAKTTRGKELEAAIKVANKELDALNKDVNTVLNGADNDADKAVVSEIRKAKAAYVSSCKEAAAAKMANPTKLDIDSLVSKMSTPFHENYTNQLGLIAKKTLQITSLKDQLEKAENPSTL